MSCDWCGDQRALAGPARRCEHCGGAHWHCPVCTAKPIADSKRFCSYCGAKRPASHKLDASRMPTMTVIQQRVNVKVVDLHALNDGFCIRAAEGYWVAGRLILAGSRDVLMTPGVTEGRDDKRLEIIQRINTPHAAGQLTSLSVTENGVVFVGTEAGLQACSTHTGQVVATAMNDRAAAAVPLCVTADALAMIWCAVRDADGKCELAHVRFHATECLDGGSFETLERIPIPPGLCALVPSPDAGLAELWLLFARENLACEWASLNVRTGMLGARTVSQRSLPRTPGTRLKLECLGDEKFYLLGRSGLIGDDGAWLVSDSAEQGGAREIVRRAGTLDLEPPAELNDVETRSGPNVRGRALDGAWVRAGDVQWSWCAIADDAVAFKPEPTQGYWDSDALATALGFLPGPKSVGPVVPTPWGVATCVLKGEELNVVYLDFEHAN